MKLCRRAVKTGDGGGGCKRLWLRWRAEKVPWLPEELARCSARGLHTMSGGVAPKDGEGKMGLCALFFMAFFWVSGGIYGATHCATLLVAPCLALVASQLRT